jgi:hypothetical protein
VKKQTKGSTGLVGARKAAVEISRRFNALTESLSAEDREAIEQIDLNAELSLGDLSDKLGSIKWGLISRTDSRPQPIDYSEDISDPTGWDRVDPLVKEELITQRRHWREWARCDSPGYNEKATIGGKVFTLIELKRLHAWIGAVIAWHEKNPKKAKGEAE